MPLSVVFDHAQNRLSHDRISVLAAGLELNGQYFSNTYIDPVTYTLMLLPAPLAPEWFTLNTGIYQKYAKASLTFEHADKWTDDYKQGNAAAGPWLSSTEPAAGYLQTPILPKNKGVYVSIFSYNSGDNFILAEGGWGSVANYLVSISWRLYSGGDIEIYKGGVLVGVYNVSGAISPSTQTNVEISLLFIPCRRRELLVLSRNGNGFSHIFEDIQESDEDPVITPADVFWMRLPTASAQVQIAPIKYPSSGYATSLDYELAEAPEASDNLETFDNPTFAGGSGQEWQIFGDPPYSGSVPTSTNATLVKSDNSGVFSENGANKACRIKVAIDGDGEFTPFIYGAQVAYEAVIEPTANEEQDITSSIEMYSLQVPDDPTAVSLDLTILHPEETELTIPAIRETSNRPIRFDIDGKETIDGQGEAPEWAQSTSDDSQRATISIRDRWKGLENYMFREQQVLDGRRLKSALEFVLKRAGLQDGDLDLDDPDFYFPHIPSAQAGDFNVVIEIGDTAAEWVQRIIEDYAGTFHWGFWPASGGSVFAFKDPATLDAQPVAFTLYESRDAAIADGILEADAWKHVFRSFRETRLECEANDIRVTGWDPRLRRPIQSHFPDIYSQDPTVAVASRPENWLGELRRYGLMEPAITTQDMCDKAATILFDRLTPVTRMAEITCELMQDTDGVPLWRGRDIMLQGKGRYRISSFRADLNHEHEETTGFRWREAHYCLRRIGG